MQKIVYGLDTGSIEGADQCAVVYVPDDVDPDELETYCSIHVHEVDGSVIGFTEAREMLSLVLDAEISDAKVKYQILMGFADAVVNSFN